MSLRAYLISFSALGFLIGAAPATSSQKSPPVIDDQSVARDMRVMLEAAYPADGPGASVLVTRRGKTIFASGRGLADIAASRKIAASTPFYLGSITKTFTAALVLKLVAEGKLSLDDPISKYVPSFPKPTSGATIRQLLNHNSGIADYSKTAGFIAQNRDRSFSTQALVDVLSKLEPAAIPGKKWEYNNGGYVLLGAIIEKVTGTTWQEALRTQITEPLKMNSMTPTTSQLKAASYSGANAKAERIQNGELSIAGAAGMLISNASDLARFSNALHHGKIVRSDLYREMTSPALMADGTTMPYGFGLRLGRLLGVRTFYQGGALRGGRTESLFLPEQGIAVVVLANSDDPQTNPRDFALRAAALTLGSPMPSFSEQELDIHQFASRLGRYVDDKGIDRTLFARGGKLWLATGSSPARQVRSAGANRYFFGPDDLVWFELVPGGTHNWNMVVHVPEAADARVFRRMGDASAPASIDPALQRRLAGTYITENKVTLVLAAQGEAITMTQDGKPVGTLRAVEGRQFVIDGTPMRVEFVYDGERVTGLRLLRGARVLKAERQD